MGCQIGIFLSVVLLVSICDGFSSDPLSHTIAAYVLGAIGETPDFPPPGADSGEYLARETVANPVVETTSGTLTGASNDVAHAFYSVPYAVPPVGNLRLKPPLPLSNTGNPLNVSFPNYRECPQSGALCGDEPCNENKIEDCLVLNVYVPASVDLASLSPAGEKLPVMFWIHGGAFFFGAGTKSYYDGSWLSNKTNSIVVNVNYRLDALGFLLLDDEEGQLGGNQGFKDQQLALKWLQDNIDKFGGDKNKVTLFGNSAGAQSVMMHLLSPESDPLFHRGIMQSNPAVFYYYTPAEAKVVTDDLLDALNCTTNKYDCLMNTSAQVMVNARARVMVKAVARGNIFDTIEPYRPVIDGVEFTEQPLNSFQQGTWQNGKGLIVGTNSEELEDINVIFSNRTIGRTLFKTINNFILGDYYGPLVSDKYIELAGKNPGPGYDYTAILAQEAGDMFFVCPSRALARLASKTSKQEKSVYLYSNNHPAGLGTCDQNIPDHCGSAYHGSEPAYVFNTVTNATADDQIITNMFGDYWGTFASTGVPTSDVYTLWPAYSQNKEGNTNEWTNIRLKAPNSETENHYNEELCDFWDGIGYYVNITSSTDVTSSAPDETTTISDVVTDVGVENTTSGCSTPGKASRLLEILMTFSSYLFIIVCYENAL